MPFCTLPHPQPNGLEICSFYDNGQKNKDEKKFYIFANYSQHSVKIKDDLLGDITWPTTEHYFQAQKFKTKAGRKAFYNDTKDKGPDSARRKASPNNAKSYEATFNTNDWHSRKKDVMLTALRAKYDQHKTTLEPLLRETGNLPIVEDTAGANYEDNEWGCGYSGNGNNLLGQLWMQVRAEKLHGKAANDAKEEATRLQAQAKESLAALGPRGDKDNQQHGTLLQNFPGVKTVYQRDTIGQVDPTPPAAVPSLNKIQPFTVEFGKDKDQKADNQRQANEIIAEFERRFNADPNAKVAITYSANNDQAGDIIKGYTTGQYSIDGSNQAQVIKLVIEEIIRRKWQDKAHILPVATSQHSGGSGVIRMAQVNRDLANIAQHLGAGWQVLGFKNQATALGTYAVGGGVSAKIWKGKFKERFDAQMKKMTEGDFSDSVLQQAYQEGQQKGVSLMVPLPLTQSVQPTTQPPTKPTIGIHVRCKSPEPGKTITDPILTQSVAAPTTRPVVKTKPILTAFSQDKDNQFPLNLKTKLSSLFQETNWEINTPNNTTIIVTDKQDTSKQIHIKKEEDTIRLSTVHTDATATEALYQSTAAIEPAQDEILEFSVEMTHHYDWKVQLKKMHDSGIDIENIKSLKVDGKEIIETAKQSIQEIKQASEKEHLFVLQKRN